MSNLRTAFSRNLTGLLLLFRKAQEQRPLSGNSRVPRFDLSAVKQSFAQGQRGAPQEADEEGEELGHVLLARGSPLPPAGKREASRIR